MKKIVVRWVSLLLERLGLATNYRRVPGSQRQLLVDVSTIARSDAGTGIQRVVRALWLQLKSLESDALLVTPIIGSRRHGYRIAPANFLQCRVTANLADMPPAAIGNEDIFLGLDLATHIVPYRARDLRRWRACGVQLNFLVYDLLPVLYPEWFSPKSRRHYQRWIAFITRNADTLICIAHAVQRDLEDWINRQTVTHYQRPRMTVIKLSGDITASNPSAGLPASADGVFAWASRRPTILMVGTIEPRKGYDQAFEAFENLWLQAESPLAGPAPNLLIVGRPGWLTDDFQYYLQNHSENGNRFMWIPDASDEYLDLLYAKCAGLLFATRAEGFGLPLLEAARHGKRALARDLPVFREMAPSGVCFFATENAEELAAIITRWVRDIAEDAPRLCPPASVEWSDTARDLETALGLTRTIKSTRN